LEANAELAKTVALLPADAPMAADAQPEGAVELLKRLIAAFVPPGMQERMNVPDFPQTSPLGLAVKSGPERVPYHTRGAGRRAGWPSASTCDIDMSREDVTMNRKVPIKTRSANGVGAELHCRPTVLCLSLSALITSRSPYPASGS
jgi:hypothetical protein